MIEAMVSLWPVEDGFVTLVWRKVTGQGFSPSNRVQPIMPQAAGELGDLLLRSLDLSRELSSEQHAPDAADADFAALAELRPRSFTGEIVVDREADGTVLVWRQRYDAAGVPARQAFLALDTPDATAIENAIVGMLRGQGVLPGDAADLELLLRELELLSRGDFSPAEAAAAFSDVADRFAGRPLHSDLQRAASQLEALPAAGPARTAALTRLWDWLDGYDLKEPRPLD